MRTKIKTREEIEIICNKIRNRKRIVTTNGSFDILHMGHVKSLKQAKSYGDVLIVCLNSDKSIQEYKSKERPIIPQLQRAEMLESLECVDYVVIFNETNPNKILDIIKPHAHVKSKSGYKGLEESTIKKNKGKIILIDDIPGMSTTNMIFEILKKEKAKK